MANSEFFRAIFTLDFFQGRESRRIDILIFVSTFASLRFDISHSGLLKQSPIPFSCITPGQLCSIGYIQVDLEIS